MAAGKRQQQLFLGLLCLCCCKAAATPAAAGNLRLEEAALLGRDAAAAGRQAAEDEAGLGAALAAAIERSDNSGSSSGRLLRTGGPAPGLPPVAQETVGVLRYNTVEVPDWTHGIHDKPQETSAEEQFPPQRPTLNFKGPLPPMGAWVPASFTNYGKRHPMGPLLIACSLKPPNTATCEVLHDGSRSGRNVALYRAWSMWGDRAKGQAYVSLLSGSITGATLHGASQEPQMFCCENTNNAAGCVACTGLPSTSYNPLNLGAHTKAGESSEADDRPHSYAPPTRYPISQSADPVEPSELFDILPNLKEQLGADADPENLPCVPSGNPNSNLPSLGDIFRSRKDLTLMESMVKTSHVQQLIPCEMTILGVTDENIRDFQGEKPPNCLADALNRPENQRDLLRLVGKDPLPISADVPLLYGKPAHTALWGETPTWNNTELTGEKILFDKGVIHLLSRNDMSDPDSRELLRKIVYWSCLHDHLVHHPALTRFALIMVDNRRALPIIGAPPGPRPEWVAKGNSGWFAPPKAKAVGEEDDPEDDEDLEEEARDFEEEQERRPDGKPEEDAADELKPNLEGLPDLPTPGELLDKLIPKPDDLPKLPTPEELVDRLRPDPDNMPKLPTPGELLEKLRPGQDADLPKPPTPEELAEKLKPDEGAEKEEAEKEDKAAARQKPEEEKQRPKPEEHEPRPGDEAAAKQKPEEADRPKEVNKPKPEEKAAPRQKPEEKEMGPKPEEEAARPKPKEKEDKPGPREEKEAEKPKPEEKKEKPEHEKEKDAAARQESELEKEKEKADEKRREKAEQDREREKADEEREREKADEEREREKAEEERERERAEEERERERAEEERERERAEEERQREKAEEERQREKAEEEKERKKADEEREKEKADEEKRRQEEEAAATQRAEGEKRKDDKRKPDEKEEAARSEKKER